MRERTFGSVRLALDRVSAIAAYDPPQARILAIVALASIGGIGIWGLYGELFISNVIVEAIAVVLLIGALTATATRAGSLVRAHDRWQVESALTFRQMISESHRSSVSFQVGSPFYAHQLRLRLQEEIVRARAYGTSVSLLALRLELPGHSPSHAIFIQANRELADFFMGHRDSLLVPTALGMFEYAFFLPNADRKAAQSIAQYVDRELKRYGCSFGLAVFPEDGDDADSLLRQAMTACGMLVEAA